MSALQSRTLRVWLCLVCADAFGQVPDTLKHAILAPPVGVQSGAWFGVSVAMDGGRVVVGAALDDLGVANSGTARVFDAATGTLLHLFINPEPGFVDAFGHAVAISGSRIVVGSFGDDTGAEDAGSAYVYDLASPTPAVPVVTLNNPSLVAGDWFGFSVSISGTRVVIGAPRSAAGASNAGRAYVYDLSSATPAVPVAILNDPSPAQDDIFGRAVGIFGSRVAVGVPGRADGADDVGGVYVYELASATPTHPVCTLHNPSPEPGDAFGAWLAMSGRRLVVGAPFDDTGAEDAGSAYLYDLASETPTVPVLALHNPSPAEGDAFGASVAISKTRAMVGVFFDDTGAEDAGSAYVYDLASETPTVPVLALHNPTPALNDLFGAAVAVSGERAIAGAYADDAGALDAGSACLYDLAGAQPAVPIATLHEPGPTPGDQFGISVAVSGVSMVSGANLAIFESIAAGCAYVFDLAGTTPTVPVAILDNPSPDSGDDFGEAVAISGTHVVVGAGRDDSEGDDAGRAYVYDLAGATPTGPMLTLKNPSLGFVAGEYFGASVAISGPRLVVGAIDADGIGGAFIYHLASATPGVPTHILLNPAPSGRDLFGGAVALSGTRVVIGASLQDAGASDAGRAYLYDLASPTPSTPIAILDNPMPDAGDNFGIAVAISGSRVIVGADRDDSSATDSGIAYIYDFTSPTPTVPVLTLGHPDPVKGDRFGFSVAISGTRAVVTAAGRDDGAPETGIAYVYDLAGATPAIPLATLRNPSPTADDLFGWSAAIDGATIAVGVPADDTPQANKGAAYIFRRAHDDADGDGLLDLWEEAHFGATTGHGADDDSDGDGRKDLLELAFDGDPLVPDAIAEPQVKNEAGYLTLTIPKRAGVTYLGQSAATPIDSAFSHLTTTVLVNDTTTLKVRDNFPMKGGGQRFLRVKVTAAP